MKKKKKKHLKLSGLLLIFLILYLVGSVVYYVFSLPVKNISVVGNDLVSENEIIKSSNIKTSDYLLKVNSFKVAKKIKKMDLIKNVKIKKSILGKITITVEENKILFYNELNEELVLDDESTIKDNNKYIGYPTLINYVPSDIYADLIEGLSLIDSSVISMISEIEYSPDKYEDVVLDNSRFLLRMNDGNKVYINTPNIERLNNYQKVYASINSNNGVLYLDSNSKNYIYKTNDEIKEEQESKDEK